IAALQDLGPRQVLKILVAIGGHADLAFDASSDSGDAGVARRTGETWVQVETTVVEVQRVFGIQTLRFGVVVGHRDELQEASPVRIGVAALALCSLPETVHDLLCAQVPEV